MVFSGDESDDSNNEVSDDDVSDDDDDDENDNGDKDDREAGNYENVGKGKQENYQVESGEEQSWGVGACGVVGEDKLLGRSLDDEKLLSYVKNFYFINWGWFPRNNRENWTCSGGRQIALVSWLPAGLNRTVKYSKCIKIEPLHPGRGSDSQINGRGARRKICSKVAQTPKTYHFDKGRSRLL